MNNKLPLILSLVFLFAAPSLYAGSGKGVSSTGKLSTYFILTYPKDHDNLIYDTLSIQWAARLASGTVDLSFSPDSGRSWQPIENNINITLLKYFWTMPFTDQAAVRIRMIFTEDTTICMYSDFNYNPVIQQQIPLSSGWNMVSVPVTAGSMRSSDIFASAGSSVYGFNAGYIPAENLETGKGYWVKYTSSKYEPVSGKLKSGNKINVSTGWNMIGVYEKEALTSQITSLPANMVNSPFYEFNNGYTTASVLKPGKGYWVRSAQTGELILNYLSSKVSARMFSFINKDWYRITVQDANGNSSFLYLGEDKNSSVMYDLPPKPPAGNFDIRWSTDRLLEASDGINEIVISSAEYPLTLKVEGCDLRIKDNINGQIINQLVRNGGSVIIENKAIERLTVTNEEIPAAFELYQNYPNPFNPSTKIVYSLANNSHVTLKIYNALGEAVRELVNGNQLSGINEITFNASNLPSGIYFYELNARPADGSKTFRDVKKLLFLK